MGGFPAKLVLVLLAVYLLLGLLPATSALFPQAEDGETDVWRVDCRHGLVKILGRKEGSFGCQNGIIVNKNIVPTRSLRVMVTFRTPPSPVKNKATSQHVAAAPPSSIA